MKNLFTIAVLLFAISAFSAGAQNSVTGKVVDKNGIPIPGVRVSAKKKTESTMSGFDGTYTLVTSKPVKKIVLDYVGYASRTVSVKDADEIQLSKNSIWNNLLVMAGVSFYPQRSYGVMLGYLNRNGGYVRYIHELGKRSCQEDYIYPKAGVVRPDDSLFIVCDGMGGTEGGEVASRIVAETLGSILHSCAQFDVSVFNRALACACDELDLYVSGPLRSMGTTLALVKFYDAGCFVAHVGDSRVYHIRPSMPVQQRVLFVTRDHSLVNELVDLGQITPEQARSHPRRNVITRALMPLQKARAEADVNMISDVRSGDYFYLCSDGMLEISSDMEIANVISMQDKTDDEKVAILREVTRDNKDNHSAILIHILEA